MYSANTYATYAAQLGTGFVSLEVLHAGFSSSVLLAVVAGSLADAIRRHAVPFLTTFVKSIYGRWSGKKS